MEKEKAHILESIETLKTYAKDKDNINFEKSLHITEHKVFQCVKDINHKISKHNKKVKLSINYCIILKSKITISKTDARSL